MVEIKGPRIALRSYEKGDVARVAEIANNINIARNMSHTFSHPHTLKDAKDWVKLAGGPEKSKMKVVFIDHYDSFADLIAYRFNETREDIDLKMFKSDCDIDAIANEKPDLIILGPGPNGPEEAGNYLDVLANFSNVCPVFGICLGFQAMMHYFGQKVEVLLEPVHGIDSEIHHNGRGIFKDLPNGARFARYHSLGVYGVPENFHSLGTVSDGDGRDIIMGAQHKSLPLAGVQFHPESFMSMEDDAGRKLIHNVLTDFMGSESLK